jgi:hypothetical protein
MRVLILFLAAFSSGSAWALPVPAAQPMKSIEVTWPKLEIRVDVRNLVGPQEAGKLDEPAMRSRVIAANQVWSQCSIEFVARDIENVSTEALNIPYTPKSQDDLGKIANALNPNADFKNAIPLTFAGPWGFYDPNSGLYLTGLGWAFWEQSKVTRIGAMVDNQKIFLASGGPIIAHELGHALSLPHTVEPNNLMGRNGTNDLTSDQCKQARGFALGMLKSFLL